MFSLFSFFCILVQVAGTPLFTRNRNAGTSVSAVFFMQITQHYSNPFLLETKAYCGLHGFLKDVFISEEELAKLTPIASSIVNQYNTNQSKSKFNTLFDGGSDSDLSKASESSTIEEANPFKQYRGYAVSSQHWEDEEGRPIWQNFHSDQRTQSPKANVSIDGKIYTLYAATRFAGYKAIDTLKNAQEYLRKRKRTMDKLVVPSLNSFFIGQKLNSELFTDEITRYVEALNFPTEIGETLKLSKFHAVGCMEKISGDFITVVVAAKADIHRNYS